MWAITLFDALDNIIGPQMVGLINLASRPLFLLLILFAGHALCDFALQNDYVATFKNQTRKLAEGEPRGIWFWVLLAHSLIHAGFVAIFLGPLLGLIELLAHFVIDHAKNKGETNYHEDQALHYICKLIYWAIAITYFHGW